MTIARDQVLVPVLAVVTAMAIGMVLLALTGNDPFTAYIALVQGAVGGPTAIGRTLIAATPIILTGLSVAIAFRAGLFNIGGQGQVIMGMLFGGAVALHFGGMPQVLHVPFELLAAAAAGAFWGAIAGFLKAVRGAHEVITTIMLNYIAIRIGEFLLTPGGGGLLQDKSVPDPKSPPFTETSGFPVLWAPDPFNSVHLGLVVALVMALGVWFLIDRTSLGFQIRSVGLNPDAAEYGGISVAKIVIISMALAGMFSGLAGASIAMGDLGALSKSDFPAVSVGFTGIAVALLGRSTAVGVILAGLLFGALDAGAQQVQFSGGLESGVATKLIAIIQGLIIFFVGADKLFRMLVARFAGSRGAPAPPPAAPPATHVSDQGQPSPAGAPL